MGVVEDEISNMTQNFGRGEDVNWYGIIEKTISIHHTPSFSIKSYHNRSFPGMSLLQFGNK